MSSPCVSLCTYVSFCLCTYISVCLCVMSCLSLYLSVSVVAGTERKYGTDLVRKVRLHDGGHGGPERGERAGSEEERGRGRETVELT